MKVELQRNADVGRLGGSGQAMFALCYWKGFDSLEVAVYGRFLKVLKS